MMDVLTILVLIIFQLGDMMAVSTINVTILVLEIMVFLCLFKISYVLLAKRYVYNLKQKLNSCVLYSNS